MCDLLFSFIFFFSLPICAVAAASINGISGKWRAVAESDEEEDKNL